jgi:hypothetical protein
MVRPPILCRTFGVGDFMRVPWPAAMITAARWLIGSTRDVAIR